jgi:hypothetical protein
MAKPRADADPEKFIVGRGAYDNLQTARPYCDEHVFRIDPAPMPVWTLTAPKTSARSSTGSLAGP